jgi:hypothetical protein
VKENKRGKGLKRNVNDVINTIPCTLKASKNIGLAYTCQKICTGPLKHIRHTYIPQAGKLWVSK